MGYPVVLKAAGRAPTAKTAAAGLRHRPRGTRRARGSRGSGWPTGLGDDDSPRRSCSRWSRPGVDVAVRVQRPPHGRARSCRSGSGGAAAALDRPTDVRVLPLTDLDAARLVAGSRLASALDDADRAALEAALLRVAALIEEVPEVSELTLNPLIVREGTVVVTQARATIGAIERDPLPLVRRA